MSVKNTKIATWNLKAGLNDSRRLPAILEGIEKLDADVLVLPEAFREAAEGIENFARHLGYTAIMTEYQDNPQREYLQHLIVATRFSDARLGVTRLGGRNAVEFSVSDKQSASSLRGVGVHFDDRTEALRQAIAADLIAKIDFTQPWVIAGDLNAMHGGDYKARILRNSLLKWGINAIPEGRLQKVDRARSLASRLSEMANGSTMHQLIDAGLEEADPKHHSTMLFTGIPFGQLDHILHTPSVDIKNFQITRLKGSDHKAVSAIVKTH